MVRSGVRVALAARAEQASHDQHHGLTISVFVAVAAGLLMGRFGVPPSGWHPPTHYVGVMDPGCGMTRAAAALGGFDLEGAWRFNPGVFLMVAVAVVMIIRAVIGWTTGGWWWLRPRGWLLWVAAGAVLVVLEVNQQLHAGLLR